ncbi:MAG TPA: efflux RND transporter periplasmic adaptor subunit, partial [Draconibacterium sp.]|nr:efflux RND transporter periplasmic adaptor subunit [Draconibacterium sp.]
MAKNRRYLFAGGFALIAIVASAFFYITRTTEKIPKYYEVKKGKFEAVLSCKGEINGLVATVIRAPKILGDRELELWSLKIIDLTQDGKNVKKGDFVIQLDGNEIMSGMREQQQDLEKDMADLNNAKIDSTVTLTNMREEIKNAMLDLEYNKIDLEQSVYESEAYQRKAQMTYQKAENDIAKKRRDYLLEQNKLKMRVGRSEDRVERTQKRIAKYEEAMLAARITAPEDGILIFGKSWDGKKYSKDDDVSTYEFAPPIATLPDMSKVISEIYVKEIDIAKIKVGDSVRVTFDALAGLIIKGSIKTIARVGESHKDFDMKVFKVVIHLDNTNEGLKPAMSSNNDIILANANNVISVPVNSVFKENGLKYVYLKTADSIRKQEIKTGFENETSVLVEEGLKEGDLVVLE